MSKLSFDYSKALEFVSQEEIDNFESTVNLAKETLINKRGAGADFLGWLDLPVNYDKEEFERIKKAAKKIQSDCGDRNRRFLPWGKGLHRST